MPPATGLERSDETVNELLGNPTNVGHHRFSMSVRSWRGGRATKQSLWQSVPHFLLTPPPRDEDHFTAPSKSLSSGIRKQSQVDFDSLSQSTIDANFFLVQNLHHDSDDSNSSDEGDAFNNFGARGHKRRLSSTTEAKRRTSIEDDDDDEVVHVKMDISDVGVRSQSPVAIDEKSVKTAEEDGELVEIRHGEMQGVEEQGKKEGSVA